MTRQSGTAESDRLDSPRIPTPRPLLTMALNHLTSQLSENSSYLLPRRQKDFDYLRRVHLGHAPFLNTATLTAAAFSSHLPAAQLSQRLHRWQLLSLSLGHIASMPASPHMLRALSLLLDELDHWDGQAGTLPPQPAYIGIDVRRPLPTTRHRDDSAPLPRLNKQPIYEYLHVGRGTAGGGLPDTSMALDYAGLVVALMALLHVLYGQMLLLLDGSTGGGSGGGSGSRGAVNEQLLRLDRRLKVAVLDRLSEDTMRVALAVLAEEQRRLLNGLMLDDSGGSSSFMGSAVQRFMLLDKQLEADRPAAAVDEQRLIA